jgi:hypothetical protein
MLCYTIKAPTNIFHPGSVNTTYINISLKLAIIIRKTRLKIVFKIMLAETAGG